MANEKDIFFYMQANKKRILELPVEDQMVELCELRRVLRKAKGELDEKKLIVKGGEVAVEATLRIIESQQGTLDMPLQESEGQFDGRGVQQTLDDIHERMRHVGSDDPIKDEADVTGVSLSYDGRTVELGRCEDSPETVNTVTGEIVPADEAMAQGRVLHPLDAASEAVAQGRVLHPLDAASEAVAGS